MDTIGELGGLFPLADVAFVGGSIVRWGGHNVLEPAIFAKPIIVGPYMMNFQEMADEFKRNQAFLEVPDAASLGAAVDRLLRDTALAASLGERARVCAQSERGSTAAAANAVRQIYDLAVPCYRPPLDWLLWPFARLWGAGAAIDHWRTKPARLPAPVISIGNLAVGGTSKTPAVLRLASHFQKPAILTRGYSRKSADILVLAPGVKASVEDTGDESQAFLGQGRAWIGIAADRLRAARDIPSDVDVFLLDDGFQHWPLTRDLDIVLIDALDPAGGGDLIPRGRLRELPTALGRAGIVIITRSRRPRPGIEQWIRLHNAIVPVFYAWLEPVRWIHGLTGKPSPLPDGQPAAFCGLGNPGSFWQTLRELGISTSSKTAFRDHHAYTTADIEHVMKNAPFGVTTEKDWVKIQPLAAGRIYWLEVEFRLDREEEFWTLVDSAAKLAPKARSH
jgi:tetraacyldisaccharide 4'-kinase